MLVPIIGLACRAIVAHSRCSSHKLLVVAYHDVEFATEHMCRQKGSTGVKECSRCAD